MILDLPKITQEEYDQAKSNYYKKPGIPEIELELESYQKKLLIDEDYSVLDIFEKRLAVYAKSLILKSVKGTSDFIEPEDVDQLSDIAAKNFIKRYFRTSDPIIGASFAGIMQFKVKEVLSIYFKTSGLESGLSLDLIYGGEDDSGNGSNSVENKLSYRDYVKNQNDDEISDLESFKEATLKLIEKECELLNQIPNTDDYLNTKLSSRFLEYVIYVYMLQKKRGDRKLTSISSLAIRLLENNPDLVIKLTPYLESALLDIQQNKNSKN